MVRMSETDRVRVTYHEALVAATHRLIERCVEYETLRAKWRDTGVGTPGWEDAYEAQRAAKAVFESAEDEFIQAWIDNDHWGV